MQHVHYSYIQTCLILIQTLTNVSIRYKSIPLQQLASYRLDVCQPFQDLPLLSSCEHASGLIPCVFYHGYHSRSNTTSSFQ